MCLMIYFVALPLAGVSNGTAASTASEDAEGASTAPKDAEGAAGVGLAANLALSLVSEDTEGVSTASKDAEDAPTASKDALEEVPSQLDKLFASFLYFL